MFRRIISSTFISTGSFASIQFGATLISPEFQNDGVKPLTDIEIKKKPKWYADNVLLLEKSIRGLSRYQRNESKIFLQTSIDILKRVEDVNNFEVSWRLGRALIEEAEWVSTTRAFIGKKISMIEEAINHLKKALNDSHASNSAGANKWYAISLMRLSNIQPKNKLLANADQEIIKHLESAIALDPKDPFARMELAGYYSKKENHKEVIKNCREAEKTKPNFSNLNLYYLGVSLFAEGNKEEAITVLKNCLAIKPLDKFDGRARCNAKSILVEKLKLTKNEVDCISYEY